MPLMDRILLCFQIFLDETKDIKEIDVKVFEESDTNLRNPIKRFTMQVGDKYIISPYRETYTVGEKVQFTKWKSRLKSAQITRDCDPHKGIKRECNQCNYCNF